MLQCILVNVHILLGYYTISQYISAYYSKSADILSTTGNPGFMEKLRTNLKHGRSLPQCPCRPESVRPVEPETYTCQTGCTRFVTCAVWVCTVSVRVQIPSRSSPSPFLAFFFFDCLQFVGREYCLNMLQCILVNVHILLGYYTISQYTTVHLCILQ